MTAAPAAAARPSRTTTPGDGFERYQRFFSAPPAIVVEWHDDQTTARGWLAINSLRGGAAGGGTRMRAGGKREEAVFLAKTMATKFNVAGPAIGGGKSVIDFDPHCPAAVKEGVLRRWYKHVAPYLKQCYGTGGDVGVDEVSEATRYIAEEVGNIHPQEGIARGHTVYQADGEGPTPKIDRLKHGVEARVELRDLPGIRAGAWMIADVITGLGVVRAIERFAHVRGTPLKGQRAIIEGFGAVGAFAAYYLHHLGVKVIATSSRNSQGGIRTAVDPKGLDVLSLITSRDGTTIAPPSKDKPFISDDAGPDAIFAHDAEIFIPAGASHTITLERVELLKKRGVTIVSCGANNPFHADQSKGDLASWVADMLKVQRVADQHMAIIPDFIANCGMARAFAYLMNKGGKTNANALLDDCRRVIDAAVDEMLAGYASNTGLLDHAYTIFVPER